MSRVGRALRARRWADLRTDLARRTAAMAMAALPKAGIQVWQLHLNQITDRRDLRIGQLG